MVKDAIKRTKKISQTDIPSVPLDQALRVPTAIAENYASSSTRPIDVAAALEMSPTSGTFRQLCGASIGYGLTEGGPNASEISLTELGKRIVSPLEEGDDYEARREAVLQPTIGKLFLEKYDGSPLPIEKIAYNVLEAFGVPPDRTKRVLDLLVENAKTVDYIKKIKDKEYVDLGSSNEGASPQLARHEVEKDENLVEEQPIEKTEKEGASKVDLTKSVDPSVGKRRVFVAHGKNKKFINTIKKLLILGELEPVVAVETQSVSQPIPDKVMSEMRSCGSAILHVDSESILKDKEGEDRVVLNPNVLIEVGAAMALYGRRFILLVKEGINLPSNLQGLNEVRYSGGNLEADVAIKLLEAIKDIGNHPLPGDSS